MLSEKLAKLLNEQVNAEYFSAYLYHSMSACMEKIALKGTAHWLFSQAKEEMAHGINIYQYILDRGAIPVLTDIAQPRTTFEDIKEVFEAVLEHEQKVTRLINNIATIAMQENDHACYQFIMWYVNEQVEEESNASDILSKIEMIGNDKGLLLALDNELATRTFVNPFPNNSKLSGI
ncbi:MAG: ferritin [Candidatus Cloacimonetes bacterium]|nr:ferritin [Candidatus Cloacimonadota bacterium]